LSARLAATSSLIPSNRGRIRMPYSYTLRTVIPASPAEIYRAWLDSIAHSEMTGGEATMSDEVGADMSAWDGYITGRNLELVPGERIVQSWRTTEFDDEFEDSIVTILLQETEDGTLLTLEHSNVPDEHKSYEEGGWQSNYFEPMIVYFSGPKEEDLVEPEPEAAPPVSAPTPAATKAPSARRKASAGKRRTITSSARKAKSAAAAKKPKVAARATKVARKASTGGAKKAAKKSSAKAPAKTSARRGAAKKAARASGSRSRKPARGKRR
jgi:uncharacterized protein YndB with AHSA1/START domain